MVRFKKTAPRGIALQLQADADGPDLASFERWFGASPSPRLPVFRRFGAGKAG